MEILKLHFKKDAKGRWLGLFRCKNCGVIYIRDLSAGKKSKQCKKCYKNGIAKLNYKLYHIWHSMRDRCYNKNNKNAKYYYKKGIRLCKAWRKFENFLEWANKNGWRPGLQVDRIDSERGYSPDNCRLVTSLINMRNRSCCKLSIEKAETIRLLHAEGKTSKEIANEFCISRAMLSYVLHNRCWSVEPPTQRATNSTVGNG